MKSKSKQHKPHLCDCGRVATTIRCGYGVCARCARIESMTTETFFRCGKKGFETYALNLAANLLTA